MVSPARSEDYRKKDKRSRMNVTQLELVSSIAPILDARRLGTAASGRQAASKTFAKSPASK
jgi:hypothetical protein